MIDLSAVNHHPAMEEILEVICNKTQNSDKGFFRTVIAYFFGKMAASQRAVVATKDRGEIPVNLYALGLAPSGYGKGHSVFILENEFLGPFRKKFTEVTMKLVSEDNLAVLAKDMAAKSNGQKDAITEEEAFTKLLQEYKNKGSYRFTFDSATTPAVKQLRQKLIMGGTGSISLQIDEVGLNMVQNLEPLTLFLELFDQGMVKDKLTKNTADNEREDERDGKTPANMLLFGTPGRLFDGGETEQHFYGMLDTGYARRCIFGWGHADRTKSHKLTSEQIYDNMQDPANVALIDKWAARFEVLADVTKHGWKMDVERDVGIKLIEYKLQCEQMAEALPEHEEIRKAELTHRYFKALKLAGAYAFIDEVNEVEMDHLLQAIKLVEESGTCFDLLLNREKTYVRLARYMATCKKVVTHADLHETFPFYKQGSQQRAEMMGLAQSWGYKNNIIIKRSFVEGIECFEGKTLERTDLDKMIVSYSRDWAYHYFFDMSDEEAVPFSRLHELATLPDWHWANHAFVDGHRSDQKVIPGFNCIVLDVDKGTRLSTAMDLMKEWKFFVYTTKRHTPEQNRFRMVLPISYKLELDTDEYREFMENVMTWLPFEVDEQARDRCRKWQTNQGKYKYNLDAQTLDPLQFIPKTQKNDEFHESFKAISSLPNLERWFAKKIAVGNRNNNMLRFALALVDSKMQLPDVENAVYAFNAKLQPGLPKDEIRTTIMVTVAKRYKKL